MAPIWESDILDTLNLEVGQPGMVSSHLNKIGVFLNFLFLAFHNLVNLGLKKSLIAEQLNKFN